MTIGLSVLCLLLAQSASWQPMQASWPAEFKTSLTGGGFHQGDYYGGWHVGGSGSATWYPGASLVDDGTPLSIQSYLQRLDRLSFDLGVSGFGAKDDLSLYEHRGHGAALGLSGLFYIGDLVVGGRLYYDRAYDFQHPAPTRGTGTDEEHTTQLVYPELTLGLRSDDVQLQASYRYKTYFDDGTRREPEWGQLLARVEGNLDLQAFWRASAYTIPKGGGVSGYLEVFSRPQLGIWLEGTVEWGRLYLNSNREYERQGLEIGVGWWTTSSLELQFSVSVSSVAASAQGATSLVTGLGTFGVVVRAPKRLRPQMEAPFVPDRPGVFPPQPSGPAQPTEPAEVRPLPLPEGEPSPPQPAPSSPAETPAGADVAR